MGGHATSNGNLGRWGGPATQKQSLRKVVSPGLLGGSSSPIGDYISNENYISNGTRQLQAGSLGGSSSPVGDYISNEIGCWTTFLTGLTFLTGSAARCWACTCACSCACSHYARLVTEACKHRCARTRATAHPRAALAFTHSADHYACTGDVSVYTHIVVSVHEYCLPEVTHRHTFIRTHTHTHTIWCMYLEIIISMYIACMHTYINKNKQQPTNNKQQPTSNNQQPITNNQNNNQQTTNDKQ